jgi:hypothetical protein
MIHPTCLEILATVQSTFVREIAPRLTDIEGRSTAATIEHLLRHIALRIELEGAILIADIGRLHDLLESAALWMNGAALDAGPVQRALAEEASSASLGYRNLDQLGESALLLRGALVEVQSLLVGRETDTAAQALRGRIRDYIGMQLADEATMIEPAFTGMGPRR